MHDMHKGSFKLTKKVYFVIIVKIGCIYNAQLYLYLTIFTYHSTPVIWYCSKCLEQELPFNNFADDLEFKNTGTHVNTSILKNSDQLKITNLFNL